MSLDLGDSAPLFEAVNRSYEQNQIQLDRVAAASRAVDMMLDGISVKTGYFFYLYMKLIRRVASPSTSDGGARRRALQRFIVQRKRILPTGSRGVLRIDSPADIYPRPGGFFNKNIPTQAISILMANLDIPDFIPHDQPRIGQAVDCSIALHPAVLSWGFAVSHALEEAGVHLQAGRFWRNHLLYFCRLAGFVSVFDRVFDQNDIQEVHFCRLSDINMQGMLIAARKRGIRSIEFQHGVLSTIHPVVKLMDDTTPATTPDVLRVEDPIYGHLPYGIATIECPDGGAYRQPKQAGGRGILIAMQPRFSAEAVDLVLQLAADLPHISLTLRGHPRALPNVSAIERLQACRNVTYEEPSATESGISLKGRDGHITGSSTMGLSAILVGIPSLFVHKEGVDQAMRLFGADNALIAFAETYQQIRNWVSEHQQQ